MEHRGAYSRAIRGYIRWQYVCRDHQDVDCDFHARNIAPLPRRSRCTRHIPARSRAGSCNSRDRAGPTEDEGTHGLTDCRREQQGFWYRTCRNDRGRGAWADVQVPSAFKETTTATMDTHPGNAGFESFMRVRQERIGERVFGPLPGPARTRVWPAFCLCVPRLVTPGRKHGGRDGQCGLTPAFHCH